MKELISGTHHMEYFQLIPAFIDCIISTQLSLMNIAATCLFKNGIDEGDRIMSIIYLFDSIITMLIAIQAHQVVLVADL